MGKFDFKIILFVSSEHIYEHNTFKIKNFLPIENRMDCKSIHPQVVDKVPANAGALSVLMTAFLIE